MDGINVVNIARAMQISLGDPTTFITRPISLGLLVAAALSLLLPYLLPVLWARLRGTRPVERFTISDETD